MANVPHTRIPVPNKPLQPDKLRAALLQILLAYQSAQVAA